MKRTWFEYSIGYLWAMPNTLLGLLFALMYLPRGCRWRNGVLEFTRTRWMVGDPWAQTWGWIVFYADDRADADIPLRIHERVHVRQGMRGGVFFLLAYGLCFLWYYIRPPVGKAGKRWFRAYMAIPFEKTAYRCQGYAETILYDLPTYTVNRYPSDAPLDPAEYLVWVWR